jgi:NAD(P)-dependent dehydrogenase (short-subunit alcohol dehydrogenase family)
MAGNASGAVVVTGASTGIGRATALLLDREGYRVFAGVRKQADAESLEEAGSERLTPITIDVTEGRSIDSAKDEVARAVGSEGLVGLVNNAGVPPASGPIEHMRLQDLSETLEVNLFGQIAVTQAFLPQIRNARGTIVFVGSIGGRYAAPFMSSYNISKFGIEALGESLRHELTPWGIDVVVVEPGSIDTEIWRKGQEIAQERLSDLSPTAQRLYGKQLSRFRELAEQTANSGIAPERVARVIQRAIRSRNPRHRYLVGIDAKVNARLKGNLPDRTFARLAGRRLKLPTDVPEK